MNSTKSLSDLFALYADKQFYFIKPGGNWGDNLIMFGAESLAARHGINFTSISFNELADFSPNKDDVIYLHGGGGFNNYSSKNSYHVLTKFLTEHDGVVIQGPCTVANDQDMVADFKQVFTNAKCDNFTFFARENLTYELMSSILPDAATLGLDHDTAFHITREEFLAAAKVTDQKYDLLAIREDTETAENQENLSLPGVQLDPAYYCLSFEQWLQLHAKARTLVTNRTHSAVAGAILGIPTTLFSGAYHKNHSIWKHSLQDKGVKWLDISKVEKQSVAVSMWEKIYRNLPNSLQNSWKIKRLVKQLQGIPGR